MDKSTTALATPLREKLDRLAAFEAADAPVLSLYLDMRPDQHGRDNFDAFLRKTFAERSRTLNGEARKSFDADVARIQNDLASDLKKSSNGVAIFACSARDLFEPVQLDAPNEGHWLFISAVPHLYPLARLVDQYPRYAALVVNSNTARLFVFSLGATETEREVAGTRTRRTTMGGWSQARYQRHVENFHLQHMKEVVDVLGRVVRQESIERIVISCEESVRSTLFDLLPRDLRERAIDAANVGIGAPNHQVLADTLSALRERDATTDAERVAAMLGAWQAGGLAVAGPEESLTALEMGQVEELLITASPALLRRVQSLPEGSAPGPVDVDTTSPASDLDPDRLKLADELVTRAQQTSARIRFIEDPALLAAVGGAGALLRFSVNVG